MEVSVLLVSARVCVCVCVFFCVCFAGHQYAKANIPNTEFYDSNQPESCILAVDAANLYGE